MGTVIALLGVGLVRLVAPGLTGAFQQAAAISGYVVSLVGICVLACGGSVRH